MPLSIGEKLGPYEILAPIGAGGMGEVYRALDTRLNREVAIKIAKSGFGERFEQEARAIAALNHPHICQIYDVGPNYMVMELLEGKPLKGPLPLQTALTYSSQILDALDAAHRKGITHRDLKPGNILITRNGIKLLDFGLAKHAPPIRETDATLKAASTSNKQIAGTLQYMSPEQLQGKAIDGRSDLFSFGCVLYELLTGRRAFEGESPASVIAAILERQPAQLTSTGPLERVIRRSLAKDPEERWQTARDLSVAMLWAVEEPAPVGASEKRRGWQQWARWVLALISLVAVSVFWTLQSKRTAEAVTRFTITPLKGLFASPRNTLVSAPQFALAPDGSAIVFAASGEGGRSLLWLRPMARSTAYPLVGSENASLPFWSPDSKWIGFFADNQLKKIPAEGGTPQLIAKDISADAFGATWGPDNTILYSSGSTGISRVSSSGGSAKLVTTLDTSRGDVAHRWPQFLPDGRRFLYFVRASTTFRGVYASDLDSTGSKLILRSESSAMYVAPGYLLNVEGDVLVARGFDDRRMEVTGTRFAIDGGVARTSTSQSAFSASRFGTLAYASVLLHPGRLVWFDRRGTRGGSVGSEGNYIDFRISPDERWVALCAVDTKTSTPDIWLADIARGSVSRVTFGPVLNASVVWSPDSQKLLYRGNYQGSAIELHEQSAFGGGAPHQVLTFEGARASGMQSFAYMPTDRSPDGRAVLLTTPSPSTGLDIWIVPTQEQGKPSPLIVSLGDQMQGNFAPTGRLLAYASNESGRFEIYVQTFPAGGRKWQISTAGGAEPRWRQDGRELYYLAPDRRLMSVSVSGREGEASAFGLPEALFQTDAPMQTSAFQTNYVPASNGQRFLVNTQDADKTGSAISVMLNWALQGSQN